MPQIVLLLSLLLFVTCDKLVKLSNLPILDTNALLITNRVLWFQTNPNQIVHLTRAGPTTINIPEQFSASTLKFVEAPNDAVLIFSESSSTFCRVNKTTTQVYPLSLTNNNTTIINLYHTTSNKFSYVLSLLSTSTGSYFAMCTCLETGTVNTVGVDVKTVIAHNSGVFFVSTLVNGISDLLRYDPHTNTIVMIDQWSNTFAIAPQYAYNSIIYWYSQNSANQYHIITNTTSSHTFNLMPQSFVIIEVPTSYYIQQYIIMMNGRSYLCHGEISSCTEFKLETLPTYWTFDPIRNKFIFMPSSFYTSILSYDLHTHQAETIFRKSDWFKPDSKMFLMGLVYDEDSQNVLFYSVELLSKDSNVITLHRLNLKTGLVLDIIRISAQGTGVDDFMFTSVGSLVVIKEEGEYWLYELLIEDVTTSDPFVIRKHDIRGLVALVSTVPAAIAVLFVILFICLYRCQKNLALRGQAPQPYELVEH